MQVIEMLNNISIIGIFSILMSCDTGASKTDGGDVSVVSDTSIAAERIREGLQHSSGHEIYFLDVIGDSAIDTLVLESVDDKADLRIVQDGVPTSILMIDPLFIGGGEYRTTLPPVEKIYLEANDVQSHDKSLRLIIRNTDVAPEYRFFDLYLHGDTVFVGLCGMYDLGPNRLGTSGRQQLCTAQFDRVIERGENGMREFAASSILGQFWDNTEKCGCGN